MKLLLFSAFFSIAAAPSALAHHPWEGVPLTGWSQGLLSGFAHPVLGADHLAFLVAVAVLCALCFKDYRSFAAFVPATLAGVLVRVFLDAPIDPRFYETATALTVALAGLFIFMRSPSRPLAVLFVAVCGVFHGCAYGGGILGAENSPLVFYLAGLAVVQSAVVAAVAFSVLKLSAPFSEKPFLKTAATAIFITGAVMTGRSAQFLF